MALLFRLARVPREVQSHRPRRRWAAVLILLPLAVCAVSYVLGIFTAPAPSEMLVIPPDSLDLGEVWEQEAFPWSLPITNRSHQPVEIADFATSCTCVSLEPSGVHATTG